MGPGDGIQIQRLLDLPTTLETADQVGFQLEIFHFIFFDILAQY